MRLHFGSCILAGMIALMLASGTVIAQSDSSLAAWGPGCPQRGEDPDLVFVEPTDAPGGSTGSVRALLCDLSDRRDPSPRDQVRKAVSTSDLIILGTVTSIDYICPGRTAVHRSRAIVGLGASHSIRGSLRQLPDRLLIYDVDNPDCVTYINDAHPHPFVIGADYVFFAQRSFMPPNAHDEPRFICNNGQVLCVSNGDYHSCAWPDIPLAAVLDSLMSDTEVHRLADNAPMIIRAEEIRFAGHQSAEPHYLASRITVLRGEVATDTLAFADRSTQWLDTPPPSNGIRGPALLLLCHDGVGYTLYRNHLGYHPIRNDTLTTHCGLPENGTYSDLRATLATGLRR